MIGIGISIPMMMPFAEDATAFVRPGVLRAPFSITRAQLAGVQSSAVNGTDDGLTLYAADVPRFTGSAQRLLIEGQGTNGFANAWFLGAVAGTPGTPPTNTNSGFLGGLSREIVGTGSEGNIPYVDVRFFGTATSGSFTRFGFFDALAGLNISGNATSTFSSFVRLIGGSLSQISSARLGINGRDAAGASVSGQTTTASFTPTSASLGSQRRALTWTPSDVTVIYGEWFIDIMRSSTATVDVTLRIGGVQHQLGAFASSLTLPPVATPGASTRGYDDVTASLSSLGISNNGACTVLWSGVVPNFIAGATHTIACFDDGSVNNRFTMRVDQASGQLQAQRSLAGASTTANAGAVTAGAAIKGGMAINGSGRAAVSLNGGAVAAVTGGPSSGLTQSRLGNIFDGSASMWGETSQFRILPFVSDAELQSLVSALP